jgi:hypothetical protein
MGTANQFHGEEQLERLLKYTKDASDEEIIVREIVELKMTLDLLP